MQTEAQQKQSELRSIKKTAEELYQSKLRMLSRIPEEAKRKTLMDLVESTHADFLKKLDEAEASILALKN